jgi:hypothetical protein
MHAAVTEVVAAFGALPGTGLLIDMSDRRLVTRAQRYLAEERHDMSPRGQTPAPLTAFVSLRSGARVLPK